jgi:hypothetical protein
MKMSLVVSYWWLVQTTGNQPPATISKREVIK